ncbi:MAG: oligosaccharide repeat unit polymerase [Chitinophagaceae bacterium]|nr:MAG: oligosaccharide repeat unit polymerase [Chitinophagaceae bacterium]
MIEWTLIIAIAMALCAYCWRSYDVYRTWFSPATHYLLRWLFLLVLFRLNFLDYDPVTPLTWSVIALSVLSFLTGCTVSMLGIRPDHAKNGKTVISSRLRAAIEPSRLRIGTYALFLVGAAFFIVYMRNLPGGLSFSSALGDLSLIRADLREEVIPGFHYFYFMELVAYLCVLHLFLWPKATPQALMLILLLAMISLLYTTAKVNIMKVIIWSVFTFMYLNLHRLDLRTLLKITAMLLSVVAFVFTGLVLSEGSDLAAVESGTIESTVLMLAYLYMSAPVGVLDKLLHDPSLVHTFGTYTLQPIMKILQATGLDVVAPSHIGDFYFTPVPANIATYLDLMYKDFGILGPALMPGLIGFFCTQVYSRLFRERIGLFAFSLNTILALTVFSSTSAANYMKPSYWFQVMALYILSAYCQRPITNRTSVFISSS